MRAPRIRMVTTRAFAKPDERAETRASPARRGDDLQRNADRRLGRHQGPVRHPACGQRRVELLDLRTASDRGFGDDGFIVSVEESLGPW